MKTLNTYYYDYAELQRFINENDDIFFQPRSTAIVVQIFCGLSSQQSLTRISDEVNQLIPQAVIIGTTTSGVIMNGHVSGLQTVLSFSVFYQTSARAGFFLKGSRNDYELGQAAAQFASCHAKLLLLFSTRNSVDGSQVLQGIQSVHPNLVVAGGNAGNSYADQPGQLICGDQVIDCGIVGVVLEGADLVVNCYYHLGWQPIGKQMVITKAEGTRVYEIDHLPAYEIYHKYLGLDKSEFLNTIEYPLLIERNGMQIARTPISCHEDNSIIFAGDLVSGEKVRLSFGHVEMIVNGVTKLCRKIGSNPAESIYVYACESRRGFLQEHSSIETEPLQQIAPTAGFFTHGEFFHAGHTNQLLNATMSVIVLTEGTGIKGSANIGHQEGTLPFEHIAESEDKIVGRSTGVLKALTHLVDTVTTELMSANERLRRLSLYDALTGLHNRTAFEQQMKRAEHSGDQVGIIVCDLDFLKVVNDFLGHDAGDQALRLAAEIVKNCCPEEAFVARIGGDEFAVLLAGVEYSQLASIRNRIVAETEKHRQIAAGIPLYLSAGHAVTGHDGICNARDAFKSADKNMYSQKFKAQKDVHQAILKQVKDWMQKKCPC